MRRISLALALVGAIAAAGCGGSTPSQSASGSSKGVPGQAFTISIRGDSAAGIAIWDPLSASTLYVPAGGVVTSNTGGINCGDSNTACSANFPWGTAVTLTFTPDASGYYAVAGDCSGSGTSGTCPLSGNADKMVVVAFSATAIAHPNISSPTLHAPKYFAFLAGTGALTCTQCHGGTLQGQGLAPSCNSCHALTLVPSPEPVPVVVGTTTTFAPNSAVWGTTTNTNHFNFTTGGCGPCHSNTSIMEAFGLTSTATAALLTGAPASIPYTCVTCHNSASDPEWGTGVTTVTFPSKNAVSTSPVVGLCSQCHIGRGVAPGAYGSTKAAPTGFTNKERAFDVHFLPAASVLFGSSAQVGYQYNLPTLYANLDPAGWNTTSYAGLPAFYNTAAGAVGTAPGPHGSPHGADCTQCHSALSASGDTSIHFQTVSFGATPLTTTTMVPGTTLVPAPTPTYTNNADAPGVYPAGAANCVVCHKAGSPYGATLDMTQANVFALQAELFTQLNSYLVKAGQPGICYASSSGFGGDYYAIYTATAGTDAGGACASTDTAAYATFDATSTYAAWNLLLALMDPGAFAHNGPYIQEILIDSIISLNQAATLPCNQMPKSGGVYNVDPLCTPAMLGMEGNPSWGTLNFIPASGAYAAGTYTGTPIVRP